MGRPDPQANAVIGWDRKRPVAIDARLAGSQRAPNDLDDAVPLTQPDDGVDAFGFIEELREAGWSNKRIARELGVHPSTVGRWFAVAHLTDTNTADEREETTP